MDSKGDKTTLKIPVIKDIIQRSKKLKESLMQHFKGFSLSVLLVYHKKKIKKNLKVQLATLIYMWLCFWFSFLITLSCILEVKPLRWGRVHKPLRFTFQFLAQLLKSFFLFYPCRGKALFVPSVLCFQVSGCVQKKSKTKTNQNKTYQGVSFLRVKNYQFLLIIRRRKCSTVHFFQEYILEEEIILKKFFMSQESYTLT